MAAIFSGSVSLSDPGLYWSMCILLPSFSAENLLYNDISYEKPSRRRERSKVPSTFRTYQTRPEAARRGLTVVRKPLLWYTLFRVEHPFLEGFHALWPARATADLRPTSA